MSLVKAWKWKWKILLFGLCCCKEENIQKLFSAQVPSATRKNARGNTKSYCCTTPVSKENDWSQKVSPSRELALILRLEGKKVQAHASRDVPPAFCFRAVLQNCCGMLIIVLINELERLGVTRFICKTDGRQDINNAFRSCWKKSRSFCLK